MNDYVKQLQGLDRLSGDRIRAGLGAKRCFDVAVALFLLGPLAVCYVTLAILNPFLNPGPVLFRHERMGEGCGSFVALKFRTMRTGGGGNAQKRGAFDPLERGRVTSFGNFLRRSRIDELPQIINVLRAEMSMIGPRPDAYAHAQIYLREIPAYALRCRLRPGISGYAQTEVGYVDDRAGLEKKVAADIHYLVHRSFRFDLWIVWRTVVVILRRDGR